MTVTVPRGSLMEASLAGQQVEASLADSAVLARAAMGLAETVSDMGSVAVLPAGPAAALLVGAAAMSSDGAVRHAALPCDGGVDTKVLVVGAVAVGEGRLEQTVAQARLGGADWVGVWLWHASPRLCKNRISADEVRFAHWSDA